MKISVIIPTYRPGEYIWECLDSLEKQTFPKTNFEIILVLNGCKEPYYSQLKEYITKSNVQYNFIQTDEGGVSNARNIALDNAKGEYITFIDDDDIVSSSYLSELYNLASETTVALAYSYEFRVSIDECLVSHMSATYEKYNMLGKIPFYYARKYFSGPVLKMIHRNIIGNRHFDESLKNGEDTLFMFLISDRLQDVLFTSKNAIYYRRIREDSAVNRKRTLKERILNSIRIMRKETKIYRNGRYIFHFYFTRILAECKSIIYAILHL